MKRITATIILSTPSYSKSITYFKRRYAELNPAAPELSDEQAITLILIQYGNIVNIIRG